MSAAMRLVPGLTAVLVAACALLFPVTATAQSQLTEACRGAASNSAYCQDLAKKENQGSNSIYGSNGIIIRVTNFLAILAGVAAVIVIIVAGIRFIVADGDPAKIRESRNSIIYAVVGLFVIVLARSIITFVLTKWVAP